MCIKLSIEHSTTCDSRTKLNYMCIFSTQAVQVADRVWSSRGYLCCNINLSSANLLLYLQLNWIKIWYLASHEENFVYNKYSQKILTEKIFILQTKNGGARQNFQNIYFPLGTFVKWLHTRSWLVDNRLAVTVNKNTHRERWLLSTDEKPVWDKLKNYLRTKVDWQTFCHRVIWLPWNRSKNQVLKYTDDQST